MRTKRSMRAPGAVYATAGAVILGLPATAVALGATPAGAGGSSSGTVQMSVAQHRVPYGRDVVARGHAAAGEALDLQFEAAGSQAWRSLATTRTGAAGRFSLRAPVRRSGLIRVAVPATATSAVSSRPQPAAPASVGSSGSERILVGAHFTAPRRTVLAVAGRPVTLTGRLLPGTSGRVVRLMAREGGTWRTLARTRTSRRGDFRIRYAPGSTGTRFVRFSFAGDRTNRASWTRAGRIIGMRYSVASWYNDAGSTACGFHATDGVANRTLPCGTQVTFAYAGRVVTATVDDRGPYVGGRDYDLNQNTAGALGMGGVATVLASN